MDGYELKVIENKLQDECVMLQGTPMLIRSKTLSICRTPIGDRAVFIESCFKRKLHVNVGKKTWKLIYKLYRECQK